MSEGSIDRTSGADGPVARALVVLQVVVAAGEPVGVREIGRRAALPRSTVSRLTGQLVDLGMLARRGTDLVPGPSLPTLCPGSAADVAVGERLRPLLVEMVRRFGEDAAIAVDDGDAVLYTAHVASDHPVSVPDVTDERHPFHLVAPGIVLMAAWPADRLDAHLARPLVAMTSHSVTNPDAVRWRLARVDADGAVWTDQELDDGVNGLAVPVVDGDRVLGAVTLFGPAYRFAPSLRPDLASEVSAVVVERAAGLLGSGVPDPGAASDPAGARGRGAGQVPD